MLSACANAPLAYRDRAVEAPVPVYKPIKADLIKPCVAHTSVPMQGPLPLADVFERLDAVEIALALCANQIELIRDQQPKTTAP